MYEVIKESVCVCVCVCVSVRESGISLREHAGSRGGEQSAKKHMHL